MGEIEYYKSQGGKTTAPTRTVVASYLTEGTEELYPWWEKCAEYELSYGETFSTAPYCNKTKLSASEKTAEDADDVELPRNVVMTIHCSEEGVISYTPGKAAATEIEVDVSGVSDDDDQT